MRNPDRIPKFIKRLEEVWLKNPDLRLGQLISNVWPEMYHPEDEEFISEIEKFYNSKRTFRNFQNPPKCSDKEGLKELGKLLKNIKKEMRKN